MAKKTFVNPFATVGFNQGNYTPYEQQNLLDAEENDRLYQEYLNSGMAQQGFQPQDNSSAIGRGLTAGAAGVIEGQAQLANLLGVGDGQMVQYLQKINRNNARKKEYSIADMIPFASDYWTNTEGAAYDVANMLGSSGAMMAETAALMTGAGAIGGALGLGGGAAAAAGGGFAGALSRGAGLAPNAVKKLAGKMAAAANNRGYTKLGKALEGPMGQMYALNILKTPVEVSSEAGSAGADALAEGADVWEARKRAGITALVQAPLLAMSNTIEAANLGSLFSKEIGKKATKEAIIGLLGDITKDGLQNAWEEGMQQSSQEYAAGKQSLLGVVNPFQWSPEALQEAAVGAVGGMALGGGNAMLGTVVGDRETQQTPNQELPTQQPTSDTPAPTPAAAEEQVIDTDKITPKGARAFLENAQSEMPAGEEYNAITELLDTGSDEDIVSKATSMGYGKKEAPSQQQQAEQPAEQPTAQPVEQSAEQPTTQPVEQQAEQPVGTSAPTEDWATAQINEAINMIPAQARAKLMNKDGSVNWDKVNSDKNVQKALNNPKGVETAIKAINGDEKTRNTMKNWGAKKKAAIIHAAQQQMAGQGATQQPVQQEAIKPVEQPAPKPEVKPAPQGDEQNAQGQNQNNGDQNQGINPQPQQIEATETDNQGQRQNGQTEQVKPNPAPVQQFKDILGDYVVDEYGFNNDNTRSYVHKADNGKDVQRVATIQRTKDGKYSASKNSSDKVAEPKVFDTLEEAEAFVAGKKTKKPTKETVKPEVKTDKPAPVADENGVVPLEKGMGEEAMKKRRDANSEVVVKKAAEIRKKYDMGEMSAEDAKKALSDMTSKYNKGKVKPITDVALEELRNARKDITKAEQDKAKAQSEAAKGEKKAKLDALLKDAEGKIKDILDYADNLVAQRKTNDPKLMEQHEHRMFNNFSYEHDMLIEYLEELTKGVKNLGLPFLKKYQAMFDEAIKQLDKKKDEYLRLQEGNDEAQMQAYKAKEDEFYEKLNGIYAKQKDGTIDKTKASEEVKKLVNEYLSIFKAYPENRDMELAWSARIDGLSNKLNEWLKYIEQFDKEQQEQQEQAQQQSNRVDEFRVLKRMATSAPFSATLKAQAVYEARELKKYVKELIEFANEEDYKYGESWGEFLQDFDDYLKAPQEFLEEKLKEKGLPHVAEYDAIIEQYAKAIEQIKNNAADQLKGMFPNVTPIEVNTVEQQQAPTAEPDAQEGESNIGAYADSVLGAGFMANLKAQLAEQKKEEAEGKKGKQKKAELTATDQAIEADIQEQQVADQVATNEVVFPEIEAAIESIPGRERATVNKYFDQHPEARYIISERLKKGVELFKVPYKDKSGKDNSVYYVKEAGSDEYVKVSKAEAIVMSKVGNLEIKETTKEAMNKEKKAKYVTEISEDEDWEYADALEEGKIEGVKKGDKKAVNIIMDFLTIEFPVDKGCPFDKNCKTWGEWVRKVALKGAQYHSEDALGVIFDTDKINLDQKTALSDYFDYLYKKYENKVEDKSRQKKDLEADMVEKPTQTVEAKQEIEVPAEQKAKDEARQRAAAALKGAFANAKFKTTQVNKNDLDNFDSNIIKQIINAGHIVLNDIGEKIYDGWKSTMTSMIDGLEDLALKYKNYAKRILDSVWDYLSNLPDKVSFAADQLEKTLTNIAASLDMALDLQSSGFSYRDAMNLLKSSNQKVYNRFKDYLGAAFRAIERYPRKTDIGGDSNVDVRAPEQSAQGNSGRGNGNGLEANSGNNGRGNQMGGGQTAQGATNQHVSGGQVLQAGGSAVSGSGPAASGTQGNQQSGTQKPDDSANMPGNSNGGRSSGTGKNGSTGNGGKLGQNRKKAQTEAERQARDASGKTLSQLQFNKESFKAADEKGIAKAVPTLLPEQLKDVVAIEKRLFKNNGKGMLVANGTGTGKTMTGLGGIVRFLQKGARKILIVVPSSNIRDNWVDDGAKVGLPSSAFATITTGKVAPDAINIITYKAFSENQNILKESWDLVVMDECQWVSSGAKSDENERTNTAQTLRAISGHERTGFEDYMQSKYRKEYRELKKLGDKLKKSRKALENLVAQFGAFGQPVNQLKANIKSMEDKQKALRRKLDIAEQKERKEYDKRLLARKEDTRVLLLSATPFAYSNSIYYAEGLLFNYDKGSYEDYMVDQFGYERKQDGTVRIQRVMGTSIPMPNHILEAKWHDMLVDSGAMINRRLEIQQDYNRRFVKVDGGIGAEIDKGFEILKDYRKGDLNQILAERFDYSKRCRLLEAIKADAAIPMIKEYLKQGKKVVIFHDYKSKDTVGHPFKLDKEELTKLSQDARDEYERLKKEHPELFLLEVNAFHNVDQTLEQEFKDKMAAINGDISFDKRTQIVKAFNNDNSGLDIVSVVAEAGKEGISLHDTTGNHPRVLINLGMPTRPTSSIQIEGRIYRLGQKSNAQIRYLYTDTKIEQKAFVDYISARTRTAETLALGDASRNLDGAFAIGYLASKTEKGDFNAANDTVDTGGKLYDTMSKEELETAMKQMYEQLNADGAVDEDMKAKLAERIQELEDERNAKKREEILTEQNEKKVLATIKEAVAGNKVTKVADGVYVVEFVGGARNLWIDLNNSQAAILGQMTEEQKRSMLSAADIKGSEYEIGGYYTKEANSNIGAVVDIIRLTEVATTHTLDHEIMHFVHNALLKTLEKQHLEKYFKMLLKKQIGEDAYNKLTEEERLARCEEMEVDAYAAFCAEDRKPKNMVERIFWKMQKWLAQFAEKFGIETPMGIYIRVRSGEMYGRGSSTATQNDLVNAKYENPARYQAVGVNAKTALGEEQPDGTIKFSVKPVDKIDGKGVPDNLDNVVDNKESLEDVKPHGSVQEALQDAQKLGEENEVEGGIVVKEPKVDKSRDIGALDTYLHSPSHLAKKNPIFKAFYDIFKKAQSVQEKLRNRWLGQLDGAYKMLKSKEDADAYHNLMVDGELKAKEYSMQELADMGIKDNVAKAYLHTRQMIRNIWEKVNDAHRGLVYRTEKLSAKKVEELSKKPFIENIMVRVVKIGVDNTDVYQPLSEVKLNDKATYEVKYGQPHIFKDSKIVTQEQLDELKANPYAHVVKEEEYKEVEGLKLFKAEVEQVAPPIGKIAGYLPHIFEQWLILVETEQGSVPVSSGKNVKEAVKIAESLQKDAPNVQFYIVPKMFNPSNVLGEDVAEGSVGGASIVLSAEDFSKLEKSISNTFKMSLAEAREALKPVAKKEGKSRFLGSLLHRKGRVGYNTDIADSLSRYIYMSSRYVALQPAKVKAFSLFERTFHGTIGEDYSRTDQLAHVTKNYILHCNGTPNHLETLLTGWLNMIPFWRNYVSTNFGDRSLMSITGRVNGLLSMSLLGGYNISSAVVGLSQLANVYAQIGSRFLGEGMYAYKRMNLRDKRILAETGILYDIGLDTASGFTKRRKLLGGEGDSGLAKAYKFVSYYGDKGMYFFKKADEATRGIAALGAYYKGIEDGMSHKQAIAYAKKVNRDSNFDYGAADAPAIYQRLSGTGIGDLMLLFQKYPIKQFEFMQQMLPYFGSAKKAEKIRFWGAYFLMAGLAGIPLGDWLDELLAKVLGYKPTTAVKSYLFTEFGDNIGTRTLAYGVLSNLGVDISRRIGMANLAPQGDSVWETALGPGLNILYRMAQSGSDDWAKTIKAFNPSLGNMAEGIRGYKTNSKNQINYIYGDMEKFFKAAGFRTTGESIASDIQSAVYLDKQQKKDARQKLMMEMVKKRVDGEVLTTEDYKALREQGITSAQFKKAVKEAKMTALQRTRARMTKQQKKDFAGTLVMEEDE